MKRKEIKDLKNLASQKDATFKASFLVLLTNVKLSLCNHKLSVVVGVGVIIIEADLLSTVLKDD